MIIIIIIIIIITIIIITTSQLSPRHVQQSNIKTQSSRHQKLTRSTHKCLTNITLSPPSRTDTHTHTHTHTCEIMSNRF